MRSNTALLIISFLIGANLPTGLFARAEKSFSFQQTEQPKQTIKVKVSGITCSGDCKDIEKSVSRIKGVVACKQVGKASATTMFEVTYDPSLISEKEIRKAVEDTPGCENPSDRPYKAKKA